MVNNIVVSVKHIARLNESKEIQFQLIKYMKKENTYKPLKTDFYFLIISYVAYICILFTFKTFCRRYKDLNTL